MTTALSPRGIRNNNPGNIRLSATHWQGQMPLQPDPDFVVFSSPLYGVRALMKLLLTYHLKYGLDTVESIINRFAPPYENATDNYIRHMARALGVRRVDRINLTQRPILIGLARAIVTHENGHPPAGVPENWFAPALYAQAADLALSPTS